MCHRFSRKRRRNCLVFLSRCGYSGDRLAINWNFRDSFWLCNSNVVSRTPQSVCRHKKRRELYSLQMLAIDSERWYGGRILNILHHVHKHLSPKGIVYYICVLCKCIFPFLDSTLLTVHNLILYSSGLIIKHYRYQLILGLWSRSSPGEHFCTYKFLLTSLFCTRPLLCKDHALNLLIWTLLILFSPSIALQSVLCTRFFLRLCKKLTGKRGQTVSIQTLTTIWLGYNAYSHQVSSIRPSGWSLFTCQTVVVSYHVLVLIDVCCSHLLNCSPFSFFFSNKKTNFCTLIDPFNYQLPPARAS